MKVWTAVIAEALARRNYSQNGLARSLGVSSGYLSQLINGHRYASPDLRRKLMEFLGVDDFDAIFELSRDTE